MNFEALQPDTNLCARSNSGINIGFVIALVDRNSEIFMINLYLGIGVQGFSFFINALIDNDV